MALPSQFIITLSARALLCNPFIARRSSSRRLPQSQQLEITQIPTEKKKTEEPNTFVLTDAPLYIISK